MPGNLHEVLRAFASLSGQLAPTLGLDIDGLLDEANPFFNILTHTWPGKVIIVTLREDREEAERDLSELKIKYDKLVLVDTLGEKSDVIRREGISHYFDDQAECLQDVPEGVDVFLFRNGGNYNYSAKKWMFSQRTGQIV